MAKTAICHGYVGVNSPNASLVANSVEALKDRVINNGNESIFHNFRTSYQLVNTDVERIDIIFKADIKTETPESAGFLIK